MRKWYLFSCLYLACATTSSETLLLTYSDEAQENLRRGELAYEKKDWVVAQRYYERVVTKFPYSDVAATAELRLADVDFARADSISARVRYEDFVKSHPTNAKADWAKFRLALTYFEEMPSGFFMLPPSYEKEQTAIRAARSALLAFMRDYPNSEHVKEAQGLLLKTHKRLARHELYVAGFYEKRKYWPAVIGRLENVARDYGDAGFEGDVFLGLYRAHLALGDKSAARESLERLLQGHPNSRAVKEAGVLLGRLRVEDAVGQAVVSE
ncbi:MAG: outer membrane protein assembly factor BamD [Proteobacteria bacterium]|nr:outer membrane protein assembly factor BamD [Cystobacterineae bacterium]MCL2259024.1 outer membrane protein assembly factor BamD [Cystobacterineae bacterium]MCL2314622.1 outer membrane protein assembly factor BamD [Pseudomonadota bacterium]